MSCPHAETTVLLHLYGEAPDSFEAHLAGCPECQAALVEHADTIRLVTPALRGADAVSTLETPAAPISADAGPSRTSPHRRPLALRLAPWAAAAVAAACLVVALRLAPERTAPIVAETDVVTPDADAWEGDPIVRELDLLDAEISALTAELESL